MVVHSAELDAILLTAHLRNPCERILGRPPSQSPVLVQIHPGSAGRLARFYHPSKFLSVGCTRGMSVLIVISTDYRRPYCKRWLLGYPEH